MKKQSSLQNLVLTAMFLAIGLILPFLTGQIPQIGNMLLPMHLPVFICSLICGWQYGALLGFTLPFLRYTLFGAPPIFPNGIAMAFELMSYGLLAGFLYGRSKWQCVIALYRSLITAMIGGRIVWGIVRILLTGVAGQAFTWKLFISGAFFTAIPGIALQLVFIPTLMVALDRTGLVRFKQNQRRAMSVS